MSAPEPTAEHIAEARQWLQFRFERHLRHEVYVQDLARAIAAAEARGFERGQRKERAAVAAWLEAAGNYVVAFEIEHSAHKEPR